MIDHPALPHHVTRIRAANPGPMTLDGTNTYLLRAPGSEQVVLVDPGPDLPEHIERVRQLAAADEGRVVRILLTHAHPDHADGAPALAESAGVPVEGLASGHLHDGQRIEVEGFDLEVVTTPGHTPDSVCFVLRADGRAALLSGDTLLGRGSTLVNHPEGRLTDYLHSLAVLRDVTEAHPGMALLPGHASPSDDAAAVVEQARAHRAERLEQVRAAIRSGVGADADAVTQAVYADQPANVMAAARRSVEAQLAYLHERGELSDRPAG